MKFTRADLDLMRAARARVYLDGVERARVVAADEEARTVQILKHDGRGYVLNADRTDVEVETLRGEVCIFVPDDCSPGLRRIMNLQLSGRRAA